MQLIGSNDQSEDEIVEDAAFVEMATDLISFFEKCKLPQHASKVKKKFEETIELRRKMMLSIDEYKPLLDLYLVLPDLVRFVFKNVRYENINRFAIFFRSCLIFVSIFQL